jgi:hypothetical protein
MKSMHGFLSSLMLVAFILIIPAYAAEDKHFIQADDYFISEEEFTTQEWIYVQLAKMKTPAKPETKGEAEFMKVIDGNDVWTKFFWQTRIATTEDFKLGSIVILLELGGDNNVYRAPKTKDEARLGSWFMAKITDVSDLYKKYVTVSGGYKVSVDNMRVRVSAEAAKPKTGVDGPKTKVKK